MESSEATKAIETTGKAGGVERAQRIALLALEVARLDERTGDAREAMLSAAVWLASALDPLRPSLDLLCLLEAQAAVAGYIAHESSLALDARVGEEPVRAINVHGRIKPALEVLALLSDQIDLATTF